MIKKYLTVLAFVLLIMIIPFWMAIAGFIDGIEEIYHVLKNPKKALATMYRRFWQ